MEVSVKVCYAVVVKAPQVEEDICGPESDLGQA